MADSSVGSAAAASGAAFVERHVEVDGFTIRYLEAGSGPPLVWLHGVTGLRLRRAHDLLAEQYRVLALEMPGFGDSPVNERSQSSADLARTLAEAVAALGIGRYSVFGHSFGGRIACWMSVLFPEQTDALVLVAPVVILPDDFVRPTVTPKHAVLHDRLMEPRRDADLESRLARSQVATLVLFGTEDQVIRPEMGHAYPEIMPNCHLVLIDDAGHSLPHDRPEALVEAVSGFLERREQFVGRLRAA